ncbi:MAG TPA: AbrB/MazE/SpoVT family DNA-binding domain-containing protein [Alphaproteobacteria bacterium]|nr:AbrB/MazE/SpoVT family DNA-binding domain-containing protein [Alphaproteobacteria bacterium]
MLMCKVTTVGSSAGFILPKEALARMNLQKGDAVYLTEAPDGSYRLTPYNPEFARQMEIAERVMHDDREILKALASK